MTFSHEETSDITVELDMISRKRFSSFGTLPRSLSVMEKAAAEIKRLRMENSLLNQEIERLKTKGE